MYWIIALLHIIFVTQSLSQEYTVTNCGNNNQLTRDGDVYTMYSKSSGSGGCLATKNEDFDLETYQYSVDIRAYNNTNNNRFTYAGVAYNIYAPNTYDYIYFYFNFGDNYPCWRLAYYDEGIGSIGLPDGNCVGGLPQFGEWIHVDISMQNRFVIFHVNGTYIHYDIPRHPGKPTVGVYVSNNYNSVVQFKNHQMRCQQDMDAFQYGPGQVMSPGFPATYPKPYNCFYRLYTQNKVTPNPRDAFIVNIFIAYFELEEEDYLRIGQTNFTSQEADLLRYKILSYEVADRYLELEFFSSENSFSNDTFGFSLHFHAYKNDTDICSPRTHADYDNHYNRSVLVSSDPTDYKCDNTLPMGWYRFSSCAGGTIPQVAPANVNVCGGEHPVWLDGALPPAGTTVTAPACVKTAADDCEHTWDVQVHNCADTFFVYYLVPTLGCSQTYCVGTQRLCLPANNETSSTGCSPCQASQTPIITTAPSVTDWDIVYNGSGNEFALRCDLQQPPQEVQYEVQWYANGTSIHYEGLETGAQFAQLPQFSLEGHMGKQVTCRARARYTHSENLPWSEWMESQTFFVGINIVSEMDVFVDLDNDIFSISYQLSVPYFCRSNVKALQVNYAISYDGQNHTQNCANEIQYEATLLSLGSSCRTGINCNAWNGVYSHSFRVGRTSQIGGDMSRYRVSLFTGDNQTVFSNYDIGSVQVHISKRSSKYKDHICLLRNDPHITTFAGTKYDVMDDDEYLIYNSTSIWGNTWVTAFFKECERGAFCSSGVAVRLPFNDILRITTTGGFMHLDLAKSNCDVPAGFHMFKHDDGRRFEIVLPSGLKIEVSDQVSNTFGSFLNIKIVSTFDEYDWQETYPEGTGLCGKMTHLKDNDLIKRDGAKAANPQEFIIDSSLRRGNEGCLFCQRNAFHELVCPPTYESPYYHCQRTGNDVMPLVRPLTTTCIDSRIPGNNIQQYDIYDFLSNNPSHQIKLSLDHKVSNANSVDALSQPSESFSCMDSIMNTTFGETCLLLSQEMVNGAINDCESDLNLAESTFWVSSTLSHLRESCWSVLLFNHSFWETSLDHAFILKDIASTLCLNNCSGNGFCENAKCSCLEGFVGVDCSMPISLPPIIANSYIFEIREYPNAFYVFGYDFNDGGGMMCHLNENECTGYLLTHNQLYCNFGDIDIQNHEAVNIHNLSLSRDGQHLSSPTPFVVYDPSCIQSCQSVEGAITCQPRNDACWIENLCIPEGTEKIVEGNATDLCYTCDPIISNTEWTLGCSETPPMEPWKISVITLTCVLCGTGLIAGVVAWTVRKKKKCPIGDTSMHHHQ